MQHIEKLSKTYSGDPHLDQTKLNDLLPLRFDGVLAGHLDDAVHALKEAGHVEDVLRLWFHRPRCLQGNILKAPTILHKYGHLGVICFLQQSL